MEKHQVGFYTNYYKQNYFFDDTLKSIANDGYQIKVLLTGPAGEFRTPRIQHPNIEIIENTPTSFDDGMRIFKQSGVLSSFDYLVYIDNDCFLSTTKELEEYLQEFEDGKYGYVCHLVGDVDNNLYSTNSHICHVPEITVTHEEIPVCNPHFEATYQIIDRNVYDKLTPEEDIHHRKFLAAMIRHNTKIGAHKASYLWNYSSYGKEWFHIGHLMEKYYVIESGQNLGRYKESTDFDLFRLGFLAVQEDSYGIDIYSSSFKKSLDKCLLLSGGRDKAINCWNKYTKNTCLENWISRGVADA